MTVWGVTSTVGDQLSEASTEGIKLSSTEGIKLIGRVAGSASYDVRYVKEFG